VNTFTKDKQYYKFCAYGFLKNLRFYDAFLLLFFIENGISFSQIGILYAVREICITVFEIPSGIIADTYGRKKSLIAAFGLYILSFLVFYVSKDFSLLCIAIIINGIGDAFRSGTHKGMIMDYLKLHNWETHKIKYYGQTRSWSQKGSAVSAIFAGILVLYSGNYRSIYLFSIIPYLLNFINVFTYPKALDYSLKEHKKRHSLVAVFSNFLASIKKPKVFGIVNSSALFTAFLKSIKDYIQPIMLQIAVLIPILTNVESKRKSGFIIGIIYFFIFLLTSFASKNAFKIMALNFKNISKSTLLLGLAIGIVCGIFISNKLWLLALLFFIGIYIIENIRKPILTGLLADNVPNEILTSIISAQSFYRTIITSILAILFGVLVDAYGIGISLAIVSGLLLVFTLVVDGLNGSKNYS
jgi:MFS family permease